MRFVMMALHHTKSCFGRRSLSSSRFISSLFFRESNDQTSSGNVKSFEEIPGPFKLPLLGNLLQYKLGIFNCVNYHKVLDDLYKTYGPLVKHTIGTRTQIITFDLEDIRTVYNHEGRNPEIAPIQETAALYRVQKDMSLGLGNTNGEEWYRLRKAVRQMMLRPKEVHYYLPMIQNVAKQFVQQIDMKRNSNGELNNLILEVAKWSQESSGMVCFERSMGCMSGGQTEAMAKILIESNQKIFCLSRELKFSLPIYKYLTTPKWREFVKTEDFYYRTVFGYVNEALKNLEEYMKENATLDDKYNFLGYLLSRKELSRKDVHILTLSLFSDGLSTTVPALINNLYCLATNPEVQEKVYKEISSVVEIDGAITPNTLSHLPYLKAVVKETFRIYPIGTEITRIIPQDLILSGHLVPAGSEVHLSSNVHFKSNEHFKNPEVFLPERWLREDNVNIHPYLLIPFGHGTRTCAGRRFAEQDLYVVLCHILQKYKLQYPADAKPLEQLWNILLFPKGPVRVQFVPRT